jgi:hypothetical protein
MQCYLITRDRNERSKHVLKDLAAVRNYVLDSSKLFLDKDTHNDDLCGDATKLLTLRLSAASSESVDQSAHWGDIIEMRYY